MFHRIYKNVQEKPPLVHCITNYVTVNDCANMLLACGGLPIMADDIREVEDITALCNGLCLNIGTLNDRAFQSMLSAGKKANQLARPVVLDPVGAGASAFRTSAAFELLSQIDFAVIRGNSSEIKTLAQGIGTTQGVDANESDAVTVENLEDTVAWVKALSAQTGAVIVMTGAMDIVAEPGKAVVIYNGHPMMSKITGSGCMLSAVIAAFAAANSDEILLAAVSAVCAMGLCGEIAYKKTTARNGGTSAYRGELIDGMSLMTADTLQGGAKFEHR